MVKQKKEVDRLSLTFSALADSTRRAILKKLTKGSCTVLDLAKPFKMSLPAVSKHIKVLENAGLISRGVDAQWRPCNLKSDRLKEANQYLDQYRKFWETRLDQLDDYLKTIQEK